ncbi:hypothetical protein, partial [Burkholderia mallei]
MKIKEGVMGPTGVPLMGELRKNLFTRRLKSCQTVYTTIRFDGQSSSIMSQGFCLVDLPPTNRASRSLVKFVFGEEDEHEEALYGTANHRVSEGSRG